MVTTEFVPVAAITAGDNDRKDFDPDELQALADSINEIGLAQPITVRRLPDDQFRLLECPECQKGLILECSTTTDRPTPWQPGLPDSSTGKAASPSTKPTGKPASPSPSRRTSPTTESTSWDGFESSGDSEACSSNRSDGTAATGPCGNGKSELSGKSVTSQSALSPTASSSTSNSPMPSRSVTVGNQETIEASGTSGAPVRMPCCGKPLELRPFSSPSNSTEPRLLSVTDAAASDLQFLAADGTARRPDELTTYRLVAGERRWRAHQLLGRETVEARVHDDMNERDEANVMLAENTGRVDLGIMEEARAYAKRRAEGQTVDDIAKIAGVAKFRVDWRLSLLDLVLPVQEAIDQGQLSPQAALELRKLDSNRQIIGLRVWMVNPSMGARRFRRIVEQMLVEQNKEHETPFSFGGPDADPWVQKALDTPTTKLTVQSALDIARRLADALEATGYSGPLLAELQDLSTS